MLEIHVVGSDLGKNVFHLICMDDEGPVVKRRRCTRPRLVAFFRGLAPALAGMEACASVHYIGRTLPEMGHEARLTTAQCAKPYAGPQKNELATAEAIVEGVQQPRSA